MDAFECVTDGDSLTCTCRYSTDEDTAKAKKGFHDLEVRSCSRRRNKTKKSVNVGGSDPCVEGGGAPHGRGVRESMACQLRYYLYGLLVMRWDGVTS